MSVYAMQSEVCYGNTVNSSQEAVLCSEEEVKKQKLFTILCRYVMFSVLLRL